MSEPQGQATPGATEPSTLVTAAAAAPITPAVEPPAPAVVPAEPPTPEVKPEGAPEAYADFALPEGVMLPETTLTAFKDLAKGKNLTQTDAQAMLDVFAQQQRTSAEANVEAFKTASNEWAAQARADKDFGGAKFDDSVVAVGRAMEQFSDPEFVDVLNISQLGNHPAVFRFLAKVGAAIGERPLVTAGGGDGNSGAPKPLADRLYPSKAA